MASKRQRLNRHLRRRQQRVNPEDLHPKQAEGLTQGMGLQDAMLQIQADHKSFQDGETLVQRQLGGEQAQVGRVPVFRAVLKDDTHSVWRENDGRLQRNVVASVDIETFRAMQAGFMCLRCYEPMDDAFPDQCDLCGYPMRERQIMDIAMEFRGHEHIGPGMPISEYLDDMDRRADERERAEAQTSGRSPMKGLRQKILSPGAAKQRKVKDGDIRGT